MGSDIGKGGICAQILLFIINIFFIALAIAALGVGIWLAVTGETFSVITGDNLIGGAALLIIAGVVTIIVCVIGILGAIFKLRVLLIIYAILVLLIVIAEIIAGILGFVYRDAVFGFAQTRTREAIELYDTETPDTDVNRAVDFVQSTFRCCGVENATDWPVLNPGAVMSNGDRPPCLTCNPTVDAMCATFVGNFNISIGNDTFLRPYSFNTTTLGCLSTEGASSGLSTQLTALAIGAGVVGIIFGILEIVGILVSLILVCCIHRARRQTVV